MSGEDEIFLSICPGCNYEPCWDAKLQSGVDAFSVACEFMMDKFGVETIQVAGFDAWDETWVATVCEENFGEEFKKLRALSCSNCNFVLTSEDDEYRRILSLVKKVMVEWYNDEWR